MKIVSFVTTTRTPTKYNKFDTVVQTAHKQCKNDSQGSKYQTAKFLHDVDFKYVSLANGGRWYGGL